MRTRPWTEVIAVTLLLVLAAVCISWSSSRMELTKEIGMDISTEKKVKRSVDCELRFAEPAEYLGIEQRVGDQWVQVFSVEKPDEIIFELLKLEGQGPLRVSITWSEEVGQSMAEMRIGWDGQKPDSHPIWGRGKHQELVELQQVDDE